MATIKTNYCNICYKTLDIISFIMFFHLIISILGYVIIVVIKNYMSITSTIKVEVCNYRRNDDATIG